MSALFTEWALQEESGVHRDLCVHPSHKVGELGRTLAGTKEGSDVKVDVEFTTVNTFLYGTEQGDTKPDKPLPPAPHCAPLQDVTARVTGKHGWNQPSLEEAEPCQLQG